MESIIEFFQEISDVGSLPFEVMLARVLIAATFGLALGVVSYLTHTSERRDKAVIHSQISITIISSVIIMVIGYNVASAFGLFGILSLIRFKTTLKDTKDTTIFLFAVTIGMSCGSGLYRVALVGSAVIIPVLFILKYVPILKFGQSYLSINCTDLDKGYRAFIEFMKNRKTRFRMLNISDKGQNFFSRIYMDQEECYELARAYKAEHKDLVESFKVSDSQ